MSGGWKKILPQVALPKPTLGLVSVFCLIALLIQAYMSQRGISPLPWEYHYFGLSREGLLEGRWWKFFSFSLFHGNWVHALTNLIFLCFLGERVKHYAGEKAIWWILWGGTLAGGIFYVLLQPADVLGTGLGQVAQELLVGASPALFAFLMVLTGLSPESRMWPIPVSGKNLGLGILISSLLLYLMTPGLKVPLLSGVGHQLVGVGYADIFQMAHISHLGGAVFGWVFVRWMLRPRVSLESLRREREKREG